MLCSIYPELGGPPPELLGDTLVGDDIPARTDPPSPDGCDLIPPPGIQAAFRSPLGA